MRSILHNSTGNVEAGEEYCRYVLGVHVGRLKTGEVHSLHRHSNCVSRRLRLRDVAVVVVADPGGDVGDLPAADSRTRLVPRQNVPQIDREIFVSQRPTSGVELDVCLAFRYHYERADVFVIGVVRHVQRATNSPRISRASDDI